MNRPSVDNLDLCGVSGKQMPFTLHNLKKIHSVMPTAKMAFNISVFEWAMTEGFSETEIGHVLMEELTMADSTLAKLAWEAVDEETRSSVAKEIVIGVNGELKSSEFQKRLREVLGPLLRRYIEITVESMVPEILKSVQSYVNDHWNDAVEKIARESLDRALNEVRSKIR